MTFLPIVERELRVAARHRFTYWSRVTTAALLLLVFAALQMIMRQLQGSGLTPGQIQFAVLKWACFVVTCLAGVLLTSDTLSEEKREGTLGLLFLTDLRGYDIVLGKLMSQSLRACYALLAVVPILGLALLLGGVTGREFWRVTLVIGNTLFLSLALGMLVSSLSRDSMKAMNAALFLCLLLVGGLVYGDYAIARFEPRDFKPALSLASPAYLLAKTGPYWFDNYWLCLGIQHGLAWAFLALASLRAPRSWQDKAVAGGSRPGLLNRLRFGGHRARAARRRVFLERNPITWLALRDRWLPRFVWGATILAVSVRAWELIRNYYIYYGRNNARSYGLEEIASLLQALFNYGLIFWMPLQASRFFVDAVRTGALELILVTPVSPRQIVRAQTAALRRIFFVPVLCFVLVQLTGEFLQALQMQRVVATGRILSFHFTTYQMVSALVGLLNWLAELAALGWFGMWMGLTNRKGAIAVLKTITFVSLVPWLVFLFIQIILQVSGSFSTRGINQWMSLVVLTVFALGKDVLFILWSRRRLLTRFREIAAQTGRPKGRWFRRWRCASPSVTGGVGTLKA